MLTEVQPRRGNSRRVPAPRQWRWYRRGEWRRTPASLVRCARRPRRRVGATTGGKRTDSLHYVVGGGIPRVRRTGLASHLALGGNRAATTANCSGRSTRPLMSPSRGTRKMVITTARSATSGATAATSESSRCCPADRRSASPHERAIPRANVYRFPAAASYVRRLFRLVNAQWAFSGHAWRRPGGDWGSRGRRFKSGRPDQMSRSGRPQRARKALRRWELARQPQTGHVEDAAWRSGSAARWHHWTRPPTRTTPTRTRKR